MMIVLSELFRNLAGEADEQDGVNLKAAHQHGKAGAFAYPF
jgi:hypothetical protein